MQVDEQGSHTFGTVRDIRFHGAGPPFDCPPDAVVQIGINKKKRKENLLIAHPATFAITHVPKLGGDWDVILQ
ncbi:hypothetical protein N7488_011939 [Penicillium malachiteum]|nr:hypothetical protein N7488_011939 [Penicillium malachiteum]